jgi:hypothetical protein
LNYQDDRSNISSDKNRIRQTFKKEILSIERLGKAIIVGVIGEFLTQAAGFLFQLRATIFNLLWKIIQDGLNKSVAVNRK